MEEQQHVERIAGGQCGGNEARPKHDAFDQIGKFPHQVL
jgi:hypothetical protein